MRSVSGIGPCSQLEVDVLQRRPRDRQALEPLAALQGGAGQLVQGDVQRYSSASSAPITVPIKNGKFDTSSFGYNPPGSNEICVVRAAMEYPVYVNLIGYKTGLTSGNRLIMASSAFRTEPY